MKYLCKFSKFANIHFDIRNLKLYSSVSIYVKVNINHISLIRKMFYVIYYQIHPSNIY